MGKFEHRLNRGAVAAAWLLAAAFGCGETVQPIYDLTILTPRGQADPFAGATFLRLQLGNGQVQEVPIVPGRPLSLDLRGIDVRRATAAALRVSAVARAPDGTEQVVAYGATPTLELSRSTQRLAVFVQPPAKVARMPIDLDPPQASMFAVTAQAAPAPMSSLSPTTAPVYGLGARLARVGTNQLGSVVTDQFSVFDSYFQQPLPVPSEAALAGRTEAAAVALENGRVLVFGGFTYLDRPSLGPRASSRLDRFAVVRSGFSFTIVGGGAPVDAVDPAVARGRTRLIAFGTDVYAIGGESDAGVVASIVRIDSTAPSGVSPFAMLPTSLAAPRTGHTVTLVTRENGAEALVFGGGPPGSPSAEVFVPKPTPALLPVLGDAGPPRRDHAAWLRSDGTVLIVGGRDAQGQPLASSVLYDPKTRTARPGPLTLATPRADAAAFIAGPPPRQDLVVVGGWGPDGTLLADAEAFDAATLAPLAVTGAVPRAGASAMVQANGAVVIVGGWELVEGVLQPTAVVESYLPRL